MMNNTAAAKQIATKTVDAWSRRRYTNAGWLGIAKRLLDAGASPAEAEWVLASKFMRWAADDANRTHSATAADFLAYANSRRGKEGTGIEGIIAAARKELAIANDAPKPAPAGMSGADLAGACEGEDIADLIDLARAVAQADPSKPSASLAALRARAIRLVGAIEVRANIKGGR